MFHNILSVILQKPINKVKPSSRFEAPKQVEEPPPQEFASLEKLALRAVIDNLATLSTLEPGTKAAAAWEKISPQNLQLIFKNCTPDQLARIEVCTRYIVDTSEQWKKWCEQESVLKHLPGKDWRATYLAFKRERELRCMELGRKIKEKTCAAKKLQHGVRIIEPPPPSKRPHARGCVGGSPAKRARTDNQNPAPKMPKLLAKCVKEAQILRHKQGSSITAPPKSVQVRRI